MAIIGITYDLKPDWQRNVDDPEDLNAEFDKPETLERVIEAIESGGHSVKRIGNVDSMIEQIDDLAVDLVFNLCEGRTGRNRESQVPILLEMKSIPYVGSDALTLGITLDKIVAKKMFISEGIPTPKFYQFRSSADIEKAGSLKFPLIVKTRHEGSSKGITNKSRVETKEALIKQVDLITKTYRQPALVEEFIKGTEFTVAVLGNENPKAMPIVQVAINGDVNLGDQYYLNELIESDRLNYICPAKISDGLTEQIQDLAVRVYRCVECRDFGRVDFRVDEKGNPFVLEINPLPSLDVRDVFNIYPYTQGSDYNGAINEVINFALKRYNLIKDSDIMLQT